MDSTDYNCRSTEAPEWFVREINSLKVHIIDSVSHHMLGDLTNQVKELSTLPATVQSTEKKVNVLTETVASQAR